MATSMICIDCGRTTPTAAVKRSRCPSCLEGWKASRPKSTPSPEAKARKAQHQAVVGSYRWRKTRASVKARDGACVACGSAADLEVHHLTPARDADDPFDVDDLVTLCRRCHAQAEAARRRTSR